MPDRLNQVVSGEPSLGTPHWHGNSVGAGTVMSQAAPVAGTFYDVVFSNAPNGAKCAHAVCENYDIVSAAGGRGIYVRKKGDTIAVGNPILVLYTANTLTMMGLLKIPLDANKTGQLSAVQNGANATLRAYDAIFYDI